MKKLIMTLIAAALAVTGLARAGEYPDISVADLKKAIADKKVALIDANGSDSWKEAHIPGAVDLEAQEAKLAELLPKDKGTLVVAYCGGPACSAYISAAKAAEKLGYKNVKHLSAGISGWKAAGEKTEKAAVEKKTSATTEGAHAYVATVTGMACVACQKHVSDAIVKAGGSNVKFAEPDKDGARKVSFDCACDCEKSAKENIVAALGTNAKTYTITEVAAAK